MLITGTGEVEAEGEFDGVTALEGVVDRDGVHEGEGDEGMHVKLLGCSPVEHVISASSGSLSKSSSIECSVLL